MLKIGYRVGPLILQYTLKGLEWFDYILDLWNRSVGVGASGHCLTTSSHCSQNSEKCA